MKKSFYLNVIVLFLAVSIYEKSCKANDTIWGHVVNISTFEPIPQAHIWINNRVITTTDNNGFFKVTTNKCDTLIISHLSYISNPLVLTDSVLHVFDTLKIYLDLRNYEINEVKIFPFHDYSSFKRHFLNLGPNEANVTVEQNMENILLQKENGYTPAYDSHENFKYLINSSQRLPGIVLFSSSGNRGIGALFKNRK